jgi:hypothetical protein
LITTLFFSGLQSVNAVDVKEVDISTADSCLVSLESVWSAYGVPYPCFPNGTALKMKIPAQSKVATDYYIRINEAPRVVVSGPHISITGYKSGLNEIAKNKAYVGPIIRFSRPGTYVFTLSMGSTNKSFTIKVSK